jgi:CHAT domain-containing protein
MKEIRKHNLQAEMRAPSPIAGRDYPSIANELREARQALAISINAIRNVMPDFMPQGLDFDEVANLVATVGRPLIYLLTTPNGSLALVVSPRQVNKKSRVYPVWLDAFASSDLTTLVFDEQNGDPRYLHGTILSGVAEFQGILDRTWPVLAERLMDPITAHLRKIKFQQALLIVTGTLTLLPLHAATSEELIYSYIPSAQALKTVFFDEDTVESTPRFMGIGSPASRDESILAFARQEVERIASVFTGQKHQAVLLESGNATLDSITRELPGATHLHFACHGYYKVDRPLDSALLLAADEKLTLEALLGGRIDVSTVRLVTLSACETGLVDFVHVPDEVVGFPSGFIQAGVPGVIGALWRVDDIATAVLLTRFYYYHLVEGSSPAVALHTSQKWLRESTASEIDLAGYYERQYLISEYRDRDAFRLMRYYRSNPDIKPFFHPYLWAGFAHSGL